MARKKSATLTEAELQLMIVLWERGPSTVNDVVEALPDEESRAYSTVLTLLRILEEKGYVRHEKEGRAYVYHPLVGRSEARYSALKHVMFRFFDGSPELLVLNMLENNELTEKDLEQLRGMIDQAGREARDD